MLGGRFRVFQTVSYQLNYDSNRSSNSNRGTSIFRPFGTVWNHFHDFKKNFAECSVFSRTCHLRWRVTPMILKLKQNNAQTIWSSFWELGIVCANFEHVPWNSVQSSVFSKLCYISWITFPQILHIIWGQFWTNRSSLEPFSKIISKFRGILSKNLCFPENVVTGKYCPEYAMAHT